MIKWSGGSIPGAVEANRVGDGAGVNELEQAGAEGARAQLVEAST